MTVTARNQAKAQRREQILDAAAELFAQRGYASVAMQTIGESAGISGPGVYRHFESKQDILSDLLVGISKRLLVGARAIRTRHGDTPNAVTELITFHVDFALADANLIRVHERDFGSLDRPDRRIVRDAQRQYLAQWQQVLMALHPHRDPQDQLTRAFGVIGLINSTAYSRARTESTDSQVRAVLNNMAHLALETTPPERHVERQHHD